GGDRELRLKGQRGTQRSRTPDYIFICIFRAVAVSNRSWGPSEMKCGSPQKKLHRGPQPQSQRGSAALVRARFKPSGAAQGAQPADARAPGLRRDRSRDLAPALRRAMAPGRVALALATA